MFKSKLFTGRESVTLTALLIVGCSLFFGALLGPSINRLFEPTPYSNVEIVWHELSDDTFSFIANFTKHDCRFERLTVVGSTQGVTDLLHWQDDDGLPEDFDRLSGQQTLRITIDTNRQAWDWIEVRTRHNCDGRFVDRIFYRFEERLEDIETTEPFF